MDNIKHLYELRLYDTLKKKNCCKMYVFLLECVCTSTDKKNKNMIITWMLLIQDGHCSVTEGERQSDFLVF